MEEINTAWISTVLTTDTEFHLGCDSPDFITGNLDQESYAILVK
jgi:hypothetical protein